MDWAGTIISALGLTGLCLGALSFILWVGVGLIVSNRVHRSSEDEGDDFADGDMPHLAPDVLTSFHGIKSTAEEQAGNV